MADKFGINLTQLRELMENRGTDGKNKIENIYGGTVKIAQQLKANIQTGLDAHDTEDLNNRVQAFGRNFVPPKPPKSFFVLMWEAAQDVTLIILVVAAVIGIVLGLTIEEDKETGWIEGAAILISVCLVIFVTAGNDWSKERQFRSLQTQLDDDNAISVIRNNESTKVFIKELVVGDIIQLGYGDILPADGLYLTGNDLSIDESTLTGETDHVKKSAEKDPMLLSGTSVMEGSCKMIVTAVGPNSQAGIIVSLIEGGDSDDEEDSESENNNEDEDLEKIGNGDGKAKAAKKSHKKEKSVLQGKLTRLAIQIGYFGTIAAILTILVLIIKFCVSHFVFGIPMCMTTTTTDGVAEVEWDSNIEEEACTGDGKEWSKFKGWVSSYIKDLLEFFIIGVTVLVVAVPEGLPLAVTISLAYSVRKMMRDNNLVRHLDACETMGNATAICSDKTGTLTKNRMSVVQAFFQASIHETDKKEKAEALNNLLTKEVVDIYCKSVAINSSYSSQVIKQEVGQPKHLGNKTECALLHFVNNMGHSYDSIRKENPEESFFKVYTFNSTRKCMATVLKTGTGYRLFVKGAAEVVLGRCNTILGEDGSSVALTEQTFNRIIEEVIEKMANQALRTICVAYKDLDTAPEDWEDEEAVLRQLTCICVVGIEDPVRDEVPEAIEKCRGAGIVIRMVTGDNLITARSIALKCGILTAEGNNESILEGKTFSQLVHDDNGEFSQSKFDLVWPKLRVLARSSPSDKYVLVTGIINSKCGSSNREVVAVTGDGTNDAPALKAADVGFAMGIAGTEVAKNASDIILTDDNFTSIVKACMWGRNVYDSISKFLQFQLTVNVVAVMLCFIGSCAHGVSPLRAVPMLWVNLIMDTFASLALATEPPTEDLLGRKPYGRTKPLISRTMLKNIIGHSFYQLIIMLVFLFYGKTLFKLEENSWDDSDNPTIHGTLLFNTFVWMQLFNEINSRKCHGERNVFDGIFNNYIFVAVIVGTSCAQAILVEFGGHAFSTTSISWSQWLICIAIGAGELIWGQVVATIPKSIIPTGMRLGSKPFTQEEATQARLLWMRSLKRVQHQVRVANAFKRAGNERHRRLSLLAEANSGRPADANNHWWAAKKSDSEGIKMNNMKPATQPLLEGNEDEVNV